MDHAVSTTGQLPSDREKEILAAYKRLRENNRRRKFIDMVGGKRAFEDFTFEKFLPTWNQQAPFDAAARFNPEFHNLYLWGPSRVGKTHLGTAVAHRYFDLGYTIQIITMPNFKDRLRLFESQHRYDDKIRLIQDAIESQVLILHELGRGRVTELVQETIWTILEGRILARRNGLIVTSNFPLTDIGRTYGGTVSGRLEEMCGPQRIVCFDPRKS